ncbi:MAG: hypothetical protein DMG06_12855 [Acidobacteria bacterium]|nr:MAG: hypothetical protein DMG06_12855 [Acidobacteriota bacterium]
MATCRVLSPFPHLFPHRNIGDSPIYHQDFHDKKNGVFPIEIAVWSYLSFILAMGQTACRNEHLVLDSKQCDQTVRIGEAIGTAVRGADPASCDGWLPITQDRKEVGRDEDA